MSVYIIPLLILGIFVYGFIKGVNTYKSFIEGAKAAIKLCIEILPFICAILIAIQLLSRSGLLDYLVIALSPIFNLFGVPSELTAFIILKPFGSITSGIGIDIDRMFGRQ